MYDCVACKYEEFFLSSWAVGDPAMLVDVPANFKAKTPIYQPGKGSLSSQPSAPGQPAGTNPPSGTPLAGAKANLAYYPDDPSNVYHSYMRDHVKMRVFHGEGSMHHLHHLHAHQWLHSPNNDNGHYLDSQLIGPSSSFTLEMVYNGSGNRNQTVGDSIFHCHFYPHFAEGMWSLWRVHDVYEVGTELEASDHLTPVAGSRALPDGEIDGGTPIPAIVPLPTLPLAPMPSKVYISNGQVAFGEYNATSPDYSGDSVERNPGFPFSFRVLRSAIPLDMAVSDDVPSMAACRAIGWGTIENSDVVNHNRFDFSKFANTLTAIALRGTHVDAVAMNTHARRHTLGDPGVAPQARYLNGLPPQPGAPYADPCIDDNGNSTVPDNQGNPPISATTVGLADGCGPQQEGWHYEQQRLAVLGKIWCPRSIRNPPEPLFLGQQHDVRGILAGQRGAGVLRTRRFSSSHPDRYPGAAHPSGEV